jgi:GNAT superfamily N-acetyltransferase
MDIRIRTAEAADIPAMHRIRLGVEENRLADETQITEQSYVPYVNASTAWVAETGQAIIGLAILDERANSVWALFVDPGSEGAGVGRVLHQHMLDWAHEHGIRRLSLTTSADTRAERFYTTAGWRVTISTGFALFVASGAKSTSPSPPGGGSPYRSRRSRPARRWQGSLKLDYVCSADASGNAANEDSERMPAGTNRSSGGAQEAGGTVIPAGAR